jgi:hypothetical protein
MLRRRQHLDSDPATGSGCNRRAISAAMSKAGCAGESLADGWRLRLSPHPAYRKLSGRIFLSPGFCGQSSNAG